MQLPKQKQASDALVAKTTRHVIHRIGAICRMCAALLIAGVDRHRTLKNIGRAMEKLRDSDMPKSALSRDGIQERMNTARN